MILTLQDSCVHLTFYQFVLVYTGHGVFVALLCVSEASPPESEV